MVLEILDHTQVGGDNFVPREVYYFTIEAIYEGPFPHFNPPLTTPLGPVLV